LFQKKIPELWLPVPLEMYMKTNLKTNYWFNRNLLLSHLRKPKIKQHLRRSFCALVIVGASLTLPSAEAGQPGSASGAFYPCFHVTSVRQVGPNTIYTFSVTATFTGTFTGSSIGTERDVIHPDGSITFEGSAVFTDQTECGSFLFTYTGTGNAQTGSESAHVVGGQGSGCYAGVHAEGTFQGNLIPGSGDCDVAGAGTYDVQFHFNP
jgi:hypothetical protein